MVAAIITISILLAVGMVIAILHLLFNKYLIANDSGKIMFEIDYKQRRIRNINHPALSGNRLPHSQKINKFYNNKWMEFDEFIAIFSSQTRKEFRNVIHALENGTKNKGIFPVIIPKNHSSKRESKNKSKQKREFQMVATLFNCENQSGFSLIGGEIKFNLPLQLQEKTHFPDKISKNKLYVFPEKYLGLWVFNFRELEDHQKDAFFQTIKKILGIKNLKYFVDGNKVVVVMPISSILLTEKKLLKKQSKIEKTLYLKGMKEYYDYSGIILANRISSPKKNTETLIKLDYLLWKSATINKPSKYVDDDIQEFQKYKNAYITVIQAIEAKSMFSRTTRVKKYQEVEGKKGRALINYLYPDIEGIPPRYFAMVLSNANIRRRMMNAHAEKVMDSESTRPSILDVNAEWLINKADVIKNKKIIYMVEYASEAQHKKLFATISKLQEKKIMCGIRIQHTDIKHLTTLSRIEPKFIVIDREVSKTAHKPATYVKLAAIKDAAKKTYIIYELPSQKIDARQREVIGLKFYYDYK